MVTWRFVRHGESIANRDGWFSGQIDTALTDLGITQAADVAAKLRDVEFDRVYCSDLSRALNTASPIMRGRSLVLTVSPMLRERDAGDWAKRSRQELRATGEMEKMLAWKGAPVNGESAYAIAVRALTFLSQQEDADSCLMVAHGGVIRTLLGLLDGIATDHIGRTVIPNAKVLVREVEDGRFAQLLSQIQEG